MLDRRKYVSSDFYGQVTLELKNLKSRQAQLEKNINARFQKLQVNLDDYDLLKSCIQDLEGIIDSFDKVDKHSGSARNIINSHSRHYKRLVERFYEA